MSGRVGILLLTTGVLLVILVGVTVIYQQQAVDTREFTAEANGVDTRGAEQKGSQGIQGEENVNTEVATFAGGCFWCMEPPFERLDGVLDVISGYTGGETAQPTYEEVLSGTTGHYEAVQIEFDSEVIDYGTLVEVFWRQIDPTDRGGQFVDRGEQYRTAIFYHDERQRMTAEKSREALAASGRFDRPIVTEILPAAPFYPAEEFHQDYYLKNPLEYGFYFSNSGRGTYLDEIWKDE